MPLLTGAADPPRVALSEALLFADEKRSLRDERFKYIVWANGKEELYDLLADPAEQRDLAAERDLVATWRLALERVTTVSLLPPATAELDGGGDLP